MQDQRTSETYLSCRSQRLPAVFAPRLIVVENVAAFLTRKVRHPYTSEPISASRLLISLLSSDYYAFPVVAQLEEWGVPQTRKRAFITFVHRDEAALDYLVRSQRAPYPVPHRARDHGGDGPFTLAQAFQSMNLPILDAKTPEEARDPRRPMHAVPVWSDRRYPMVAAIPANSGATAWENRRCELCCLEFDVGPDSVACPSCGGPLLRPLLFMDDGWRLVNGFPSTSYRRMAPDRPAATITTASGHIGSSITIHPWENRLLSPLECAALQTFPEDFDWGDALKRWGPTNVRAMIGEAVPPLFTFLHGVALRTLLTRTPSMPLLSVNDRRCVRARYSLGVRRGGKYRSRPPATAAAE
jgi:DNA (cytosine-5)-methyltransferase 1